MNADAIQSDRIRRLQIEALSRVATSTAAINAVNALMIAWVFWSASTTTSFAIWLSANLLYSLIVLLEGNSVAPFRRMPSQTRLRLITARAAMLGVIWGCLPGILLPQAGAASLLIIGFITAGMVTGGVTRLAAAPMAAMVFIWAMTSLSCVGFFCFAQSAAVFSSLFMASYAAFLTQHVRSYSANLLSSWGQKIALEQTHDTIALLLNQFQDSASDWLWECGADGRLRQVSDRFAEAAGRSTDVLGSLTMADLLSDPSPAASDVLDKIQRGETFRDIEVVVAAGGGRRRWVLSGRPIFEGDGHPCGYRGVGSDITARAEAEARATYLADFDATTGLVNGTRFRIDAAAALRDLTPGATLAILRVDLDQFDSLSAAIGPSATQALMSLAAERLRGVVAQECRLGWLRSGAFVAQITTSEERPGVVALAEAIREAFLEPLATPDIPIAVGVVIGVATSTDAEAEADTLIRHAGLALERSRSSGETAPCFFEAGMDASARRRILLEQGLRHAIERNELVLHYQPIVNLRTGAIGCCEALLRWNSHEYGMISPLDFIPLAEETGLILPIGEWIVGEAARTAAQWPASVRVAVNLSPIQFRGNRLLTKVVQALEDSGLPPDRFELEITESTFLDADDHAIDLLRRLKALGARVALDDFGTGYSSLSYLRTLPLNKIKIDKSFVDAMLGDRVGGAIVKVIIDLAVALGMETTAEGVESEAQLAALRSLGCDTVQGFVFARPMPAADIRSLLHDPEPSRAAAFRDQSAAA